jgi:hypothetical protein
MDFFFFVSFVCFVVKTSFKSLLQPAHSVRALNGLISVESIPDLYSSLDCSPLLPARRDDPTAFSHFSGASDLRLP